MMTNYEITEFIALKGMFDWKLKATFNNVFTLKILSYMSLHAISVFDKV